MTDELRAGAGASERAHDAGAHAPAAPRKRRMSAKRKQEAVLRLLRGEDLELVSRELGVTAADLSAWRDDFLAAGEASLKSRPEDHRDRELRAMREKIGDLTMANELLEAKIDRMEGGVPFSRRRSPSVGAMSRTVSLSAKRTYGLVRVCRVWRLSRATVFRRLRAANRAHAPRGRPGPHGPMSDGALAERIRALLASSPFPGEGYRKVWARLRVGGVRTSPRRVLRVMRENGLLVHQRPGNPRGPRAHDGKIVTERVDEMWDEGPARHRSEGGPE